MVVYCFKVLVIIVTIVRLANQRPQCNVVQHNITTRVSLF